jgi:hypothetical protein
MRRWLRPLWIVLALLFLLEAWLWDHLEPIVSRIVNLVPWGRFKVWLKDVISDLPPWAMLVVFVIPFIVLLPLKFLEVWLLATRQWVLAGFVLVFAKLLGLGVTAFVFDATREKLLQIGWFRSLYDWIIGLRDWADEQVAPVKARIRKWTWMMQPGRAGRFLRRLRRKMQRA